MTVVELRKMLDDYPDDMRVYVIGDWYAEDAKELRVCDMGWPASMREAGVPKNEVLHLA